METKDVLVYRITYDENEQYDEESTYYTFDTILNAEFEELPYIVAMILKSLYDKNQINPDKIEVLEKIYKSWNELDDIVIYNNDIDNK